MNKYLTGNQLDNARKTMLLAYMDYHLKLLSEAVQKNDEETVNFEKAELEDIRQSLLEIGFFG